MVKQYIEAADVGAAPALHEHRAATETEAGFVEHASAAEVQAGTTGNLVATAARLKAELDRRETPEPWNTPTLENGWVSFGGSAETPGYRKEPLRLVRLKDSVKNGTVGTATPIFTLPVGYRPPGNCYFAIASTSPTIAAVLADGQVAVYSSASNAHVALDGVVFPVTA